MSVTQKTLLSCSAVCYVLTLFSMFRPSLWMMLLFFILHSVTLMLFSYLTYRAARSGGIDEELLAARESCRALTEEKERLTRELAAEKEQAASRNSERQAAISDLESQLMQAKQEAAALEKQARDAELAEDSLLPPVISGNGSPEPLDIIGIARDTIREFLPYSEKAGIQILISSSSDTLMVRADPSRICTLFRNIIDNSIKYMNRTGNLVITLSAVGDDIFIVLKDNGQGLSESETPHIFEMNYQGSNRISGNGLGLTQAKAIVNSYGGTIYARSAPGKGMGIYIQIPIE